MQLGFCCFCLFFFFVRCFFDNIIQEHDYMLVHLQCRCLLVMFVKIIISSFGAEHFCLEMCLNMLHATRDFLWWFCSVWSLES